MFGYLGGRNNREVLYGCQCEIQLVDNPRAEILTSFDHLRGKLLVTASTKVCFKSLWVQLEGNATARFQTKVDNRMTHHLRTEKFLPDESSEAVSPTTVYLLGRKHDYTWKESEKVYLERGIHSFPFRIQLKGQKLPATFQSCYGRIQYKLVAYAISLRETYWHEVAAVEKILKTKGYLNLALDPALLKPLVVTRKKDKSFFSKRPFLKVSLTLDQRGYVPGEDLVCQMCLENSSDEEITRIHLALVQKIIYFDSKVSKSTVLVLEDQEAPCESCSWQINWDLDIIIPPNLMPTFTKERKSVEILYFLQFIVQGRGKSLMKGETAIVIGTTKELPDTDTVDSLKVPSPVEVRDERRLSTDSMWDTISIQTCSTLPPSYSKIGSRRPSLESLPPAYDVVAGDGNWDDFNQGFRPRSQSSMM